MQRPSLKRDRSALDDVSGGSLDAILNVGKRPTSPSKSTITPGAKRRLPIVEGVLSPMKPQFAHALYTLMERRPSASPVRQNLFQSLTVAAVSAAESPNVHASPLRKRPRIERTSSQSPEPFQTPRKPRRRDTTSRVPALRERELYECLERAPLPPMTPSVRWFSESPAATPVPHTPAAFLVELEPDDSEGDSDPGFTIWSDRPHYENHAVPPPKPLVVVDDEDPNEEDKENQKPAFPKMEDGTTNARATAFSTLSSPERRRKLPVRSQGPLLPLPPASAPGSRLTLTTRRSRPAPATGRALLQREVDGDAGPDMPMLSMA